jgi:hypothetical protein
MQIWLEIIGTFSDREGKYLICPIHSSTRKNYPMYRILEAVQPGDVVFHCVLEKASKKRTAISSYSKVRKGFYIDLVHDALCPYPPPYRRIDLYGNTPLSKPITMEMLNPYRLELESIAENAGITRTPFNKNFQLKQMYLARIPTGFLKILEEVSETTFDFT